MANVNEKEINDFNQSVDELEKLPPANILIAGKTGSGKSTLINAMFGIPDLAKTGKGKPITDKMFEYKTEEYPIHIWDTVGFELDKEKNEQSIANIRTVIADKKENGDKYDLMHAIWYCIQMTSDRAEKAEFDFIRQLHSLEVPFIIVITKCYATTDEEIEDFRQYILSECKGQGMHDIEVIPILAQDKNIQIGKQVIVQEAFGTNELQEYTLERLPNFIKKSFISAQKVNASRKRLLCEDEINKLIGVSRNGVIDKIAIVNMISSDNKLRKLYRSLAQIYNTNIKEDALNALMKEMGGLGIDAAFWGLLFPAKIDTKYQQKLIKLFEEEQAKKEELGIENKKLIETIMSLEAKEKAPKLYAFYGFTFVNAIEKIWEKFTVEQLNDMEIFIPQLVNAIKKQCEAYSKKIRRGEV